MTAYVSKRGWSRQPRGKVSTVLQPLTPASDGRDLGLTGSILNKFSNTEDTDRYLWEALRTGPPFSTSRRLELAT